MAVQYKYETLEVVRWSGHENVLEVRLNRPSSLNAMNGTFWRECRECFLAIDTDPTVRCVVVSGNGKHFTAGLDLSEGISVFDGEGDQARKAFTARRLVMLMQDAFTAIENCKQPVIAAVHGACIGGGVDLICACDIRYSTKDAYYCIKEVDIGLAADVGTLQRMPKIVGNEGFVRELAYTARRFPADEAHAKGFVTNVFPDRQTLLEKALLTAGEIASKSPVAIYGTKQFLNHARDHTVREGLEYAALWNVSMLNTEDLPKAAAAAMQKKKTTFSNL